MMNCQQATHRVSEGMDRPLGMRERLQLRLHLLLCANCRHFRRQLVFLRQAARQDVAGRHR
ncbi:zf-HC2 domain-containing protein [Chitinimonas sp. BJYL2]|uniref:anti-sigma factor family protein n=1 Tax=Chitinimonas sp. BJYL2 TaxID=2976696 RepID=UPI0027E3D592|nr:zf-HC2 domain-containing protein [Chitinimonas sp. BJYL2]